MKTRRIMAFFMALSGVAGCGAQDITTGAWAEFTTTLQFTNSAATASHTYKPSEREEVAAITDPVACGVLDIANCHLALTGLEGAEGGDFSLTATIVDGDADVELFAWKGTLGLGGKAVPLDGVDAGLSDDGVSRIAEILLRADKSFDIRYDYSTAATPDSITIDVVLRFHLATANGTCPAQ